MLSLRRAGSCEVSPKQFSAVMGIRSKQLVEHAAALVSLTLPDAATILGSIRETLNLKGDPS